MSLLQNSNAISSGGYNITDSLRFRSSASAYLTRTPTTAGNRKTWTWSAWVKRGKLGAGVLWSARSGNTQTMIYFTSSDTLRMYSENSGGTTIGRFYSSAVFKDPSAWYHIVVVLDASNATASDRVILYVNGVRQTITIDTAISNADHAINSTIAHTIGREATQSTYFDGYIAENNFVDGQALTPSDFGETNADGVWSPIEYTGTYGTNGFYLPMKETTQATGFNTVLYTGTGSSSISITGAGFSPDLVWVKQRNIAQNHVLNDSVRGAGKILFSDVTNAEYTATTYGQISSFDADGFTASKGSDPTYSYFNQSGGSYVAWCWDAGSSTVSNTDGTITSSVRANPASGFSVVTYTGNATTGATVGHGLGTAPNMYIIKDRDGASNWVVFNDNLAANNNLYLNTTDAAFAAAGFAGMGATSSILQLPTGGINSTNNSGNKYVAYCFSEVAGYSKIGSYTGNGSTSGPTVTTGFRPAFVMIKSTTTAGSNWWLADNTRDVSNPNNALLFPNLSNAEYTTAGVEIDFNDTGFQLKTSSPDGNKSGDTFIYMAFADTRDFQWNFDASGNKNNWTPNNINSNASSETTYDLMSDTPSLADEDTANYPTLNPLLPPDPTTGSSTNLENGNLTSATYSASYNTWAVATWALPPTGKYYWEVNIDSGVNTADWSQIGILKVDAGDYLQPRANGEGRVYAGYYGYKNTALPSPLAGTAYGATYGANDTIGIAVDMDNGAIYFSKNNVWQNSGVPTSGASKTGAAFTDITNAAQWMPMSYTGSVYGKIHFNFGQRPFKYTPPTGYKKLNTFNLPDSSITDGSQYMNTVLYTGNAPTGQSITGVGFTPDLTWIKSRSSAYSHGLNDSVRGAGNFLYSDLTAAESSYPTDFVSFDTDGFTLGTGSGNVTNASSGSYVAWNWRGSDSTAVSNTDGTITSTVSANTTSGFSVVTYTGTGANATVGHGLGVAPTFIIVKNRSGTQAWTVYYNFDGLGAGVRYMTLNATDASTYDTTVWNSTISTSSVFSLGTSLRANGNGGTYVAYCFAEVEGFSKFGSYIGNGSADGPFVYTGFRPAFIMVKRTDTTQYWGMYDSARDTYNQVYKAVFANASNAEDATASDEHDFLSNGFKMRNTGGSMNASGGTYIYTAFAENPFKNSLAR